MRAKDHKYSPYNTLLQVYYLIWHKTLKRCSSKNTYKANKVLFVHIYVATYDIFKAIATSPASPVLAGPLFSELKIIFIKIAFI